MDAKVQSVTFTRMFEEVVVTGIVEEEMVLLVVLAAALILAPADVEKEGIAVVKALHAFVPTTEITTNSFRKG